MKKFFKVAKKTYAKLFISTIMQNKVFHGCQYLKILSRHKETWYDHKDAERFKKDFLT